MIDISFYEDIIQLLKKNNMHISTAESCTGGMFCSKLIDVPGASEVINTGFVTYSEGSKCRHLGLSQFDIDTNGVVSEFVAANMARGCAVSENADIGVGITGYAGDKGENGIKGGTVCFGFYICGRTVSRTVEFGSIGRNVVRQKSCDFAAETLFKLLEHMNSEINYEIK